MFFQVLYLQAAVMIWVTTTLMKKLFFGTLRAAEVEVYTCACDAYSDTDATPDM